MKHIVKKILKEYMEENDNDYKDLSFVEAKHMISKILPQSAKYQGIELDGNKFNAGSGAILYYLKKCHSADPNVKFDLIEKKSDLPSDGDYSLVFKVKVKSDTITNIIKGSRNIDLSDWL